MCIRTEKKNISESLKLLKYINKIKENIFIKMFDPRVRFLICVYKLKNISERSIAENVNAQEY